MLHKDSISEVPISKSQTNYKVECRAPTASVPARWKAAETSLNLFFIRDQTFDVLKHPMSLRPSFFYCDDTTDFFAVPQLNGLLHVWILTQLFFK